MEAADFKPAMDKQISLGTMQVGIRLDNEQILK